MPAMRMTKTIEAGGRKVAAGKEPLICTASPGFSRGPSGNYSGCHGLMICSSQPCEIDAINAIKRLSR